MAGHVKTPEKSPETGPQILPQGLAGGRLLPARHEDPDVGPLVPGATAVVAERRLDDKPGALELTRHVGHRERAKREIESMFARLGAAPLDVGLLERGQAPAAVLP